MAERYWYGTLDMVSPKPNPVKRALRNMKKLASATVAGSHTTDETLSIDFDTALSIPKKNAMDHNLLRQGYAFRRQETV